MMTKPTARRTRPTRTKRRPRRRRLSPRPSGKPVMVLRANGSPRCHTEPMSTNDQKVFSVIHGEALKLARDDVPQELLDLPAVENAALAPS